jgi:hypothetical protein
VSTGFPIAKVLQIATIVPARVMKDDKIMAASSERITDLRKTERVMRAGRLYNSRDLYSAVGVNPGR